MKKIFLILILPFFCFIISAKEFLNVENLVGLIVSNSIYFYENDSSSWKLDPPSTFSLPVGSSNVFATSWGGLAVVNNNIIQFYDYESNHWRMSSSPSLSLN